MQCQNANFCAEARNLHVWVQQKTTQATSIKSFFSTEVSVLPPSKLSLKFQNLINNQLSLLPLVKLCMGYSYRAMFSVVERTLILGNFCLGPITFFFHQSAYTTDVC